ncbi:MAG TPA: NUDIX domain-containing protein [Candidatus Hydrogenedentes bacterium]|nr:NUDIX domain-containing protein [Candidatus Hydrogenedentota bacterium]
MTDNRYTRGPRVRVAAVIVRNGEILLAEHLKDGRAYYLLPGGGVDQGETLREALARELWEETRLDVTPGRLLFICESIAPDHSRHIIQLAFAADIEAEAMPSKGDDPRVSGAYFFPPEALPEMPLFPPMQETLVAGLRHGFPDAPPSLGNCWLAQ